MKARQHGQLPLELARATRPGWHANRTRGMRQQAGAERQQPVAYADPMPEARRAARRRWAELLRRSF